MYTATCRLTGATVMSHSAPVSSVKDKNESSDAFERRTWREHLHVTSDDIVFIPPMALKLCLMECAQYLAETIPGKGKATFTKHITAGVQILNELPLDKPKDKPILGKTIEPDRLYLNADGRRGGGTRVWRMYPIIPTGWTTVATIYVLDITIEPDKLQEYLQFAGQFIGLGRFRGRVGGLNGRFRISDFSTRPLSIDDDMR